MYCPPESGNIEPNSAKAKQAQSEISAPSTHTRRKSIGWGSGLAMSFAVRKIEDPIMPLTSSSTETSRLSPRTSVGLDSADFNSGSDFVGVTTGPGSIIQFQVRRETPEACRNGGRSPRNNHRRSADP